MYPCTYLAQWFRTQPLSLIVLPVFELCHLLALELLAYYLTSKAEFPQLKNRPLILIALILGYYKGYMRCDACKIFYNSFL